MLLWRIVVYVIMGNMLILRKVLFYLFLIAYLISCPLIILQTMGIVFKVGSQSIERTGLIYLSTIPHGADVYIGNKKFPGKTPTIIRNLYPGKYHIKISLTHHETWDKILPVREEKATAAEHILLIPHDWKIKKLTNDAFEGITAIDNQPFMLLSGGALLKNQFIHRLKEDTRKILSDRLENTILDDNLSGIGQLDEDRLNMRIIKIYTAPGSSFLLFRGMSRGKTLFIWVDLKTNPATVQDITELLPAPPGDVLWAAGKEKILYAAVGSAVHILDLDAKTASSVSDEEIDGFALANDRLYLLTKDDVLKRCDAKGKNSETLFDIPKIRYSLFGKRRQFKIAVLDEKLILFLSKEGSFLYNRSRCVFINKDVKGFVYNKSAEKLLLYTDNDIGLIDCAESNKAGLFKFEPEVTWLGVKTRGIKKAFWINRGNQIIFHTANTVFLTENKTFNQTHVTKVVSIKKGASISYAQKTGILYYLDYKSRRLFAADIIPQRELLPHSYSEDTDADTKKPETANAI